MTSTGVVERGEPIDGAVPVGIERQGVDPRNVEVMAKDVDITRRPRWEWKARNEAAGVGVF